MHVIFYNHQYKNTEAPNIHVNTDRGHFYHLFLNNIFFFGYVNWKNIYLNLFKIQGELLIARREIFCPLGGFMCKIDTFWHDQFGSLLQLVFVSLSLILVCYYIKDMILSTVKYSKM